jgi:hypothetical protein
LTIRCGGIREAFPANLAAGTPVGLFQPIKITFSAKHNNSSPAYPQDIKERLGEACILPV